MAEKINLRSSKVKEQKRRVADYGTETPLSSTAVERGSTRWLSGSTVVIEGLLDVTGLTTISGALNVSGTSTFSGSLTVAGPTGITGALTIAGSMDVTGPTTLAGALDITGDTKVSGDFEITAGGKFRSGTVEINPDGSAKFGPTTISKEGVVKTGQMELRPDSGGQLAFGGGALSKDSLGLVLITDGPMELNGTSVDLRGTTNINGALWLKGLPTTALPPNLHVTSLGQTFRSTWTPS